MKVSLPDKIANGIISTRAIPQNYSKLNKINVMLGGEDRLPTCQAECRDLRSSALSRFVFTVSSRKEDMLRNKFHIGANRFYLMNLYIQINKELGGICEY